MNMCFAVAALAMAGIWAIHTFVGGRGVARPLIAAGDIADIPKWTQYYCWHLVTITLAATALAFAIAAVLPSARDLGLAAGLLTTVFGLYGLILPPRVALSYRAMPQGLLLLPVGLIAVAGCL